MEVFKNVLLVLLICSCTGQKEVIDSYDYFTVDSVRSDGLYEILIKDPDPVLEYGPMLFPSGGSAMIPEYRDRWIKITYKSDSVWISGDTLILRKK